MAEEDTGDKTEAATPRRRQEAREEGNVARSTDLTAAVVLLSIFILLSWYGPNIVRTMQRVLGQMLGADWMNAGDVSAILLGTVKGVLTIAGALAPVFIGIAIVAIGANLAQVGLFFNPARLTPNLAALNPLRGLGRLKGQGPIRLGMDILKLVLVATAGWSAVRSRLPEIVAAGRLDFGQIIAVGGSVMYAIAMRLGAILLILALVDYIYQRYQLERDLRMSKQEVKEEMRRMEGDPKVKMRRRQIAIQMHNKRLKKEVPKADVIITNPTEFAVALEYDQATMRAPRVVAKGQGIIAARIREIAIEHGIPILERKPLARALYRLVNVGQEIPEQFYSTVAEIIAYVYELTGRIPRRKTA